MFLDSSEFKRLRAQRGLLRAFKNVKSVTPEIKHKPFFEGFLIHTQGHILSQEPYERASRVYFVVTLGHESSLSNHKKFSM